MPLGKGVRFRVKRAGGKKVRLAFRGKKVIETKVLNGKHRAKRMHRGR
jgi:hypothetical protein